MKNEPKQLSFDQALKTLGIEDYKTRIINSNSKGKLDHLDDYIVLANILPDSKNFRAWFIKLTRHANETWKRPKSVYQHILTIFKDSMVDQKLKKKKKQHA